MQIISRLKVYAVFTLIAFAGIACSSMRSRSEKSTRSQGGELEEAPYELAAGSSADSYTSAKSRAVMPAAPAVTSPASRKPAPKISNAEAKAEPAKKRMVIYFGRLELLVYDLQKTIKEFEEYAKSLGGFSENISINESSAQITLRVPVAKFDSATETLSSKGKLLNREINSSDVTREFTDMSTRLANEKAVREKLYKLLAETKNVKQKMRILREIDRLNKSIEATSLRVKLLSDRANMSTIIADLRLFKSEKQIFLPSPFAWIRDLKPAGRSIVKYDDIKMPAPATFFSDEKNFKKEKSSSLFISPQQTVVRAGYVKNDPEADLKFWSKALDIEMKNRSFEKVKDDSTGKNKNGAVHIYKVTEGLRVSYYAVALFVTTKSVFVVETYYPNAKEYDNLQAAVFTSLSATEVSE